MRATRSLFAVAVALVASATCLTAHADGPAPPDVVEAARENAPSRIDRTWLYVDDARVAAPHAFVAMTSLSYTAAGSSLTRPFAANTAAPGALLAAGGEAGLLPGLSVLALGQAEWGGVPGVGAGALAGLRLRMLPASVTSVRLVAAAGYLRESSGGESGAWAAVSVSGDVARVRLAATVHGEHVFAAGRDGADVMVETGASVRIVDGVRAGIEYVGQDLEEALADGAEAGARHFLGPSASWQLLGERLTLAVGPAFGLSTASPRLLGRFSLAYGF